MRLHRLVFVMGLTIAAFALSACQSTSQPAKSTSSSESSGDPDLERLTALLEEMKESGETGSDLKPTNFEERKSKMTAKLSAHLLKGCIAAGAELSDFTGPNLPRCAYENVSKLVDPTGAVGSHCDDSTSTDAYVDCAGNGMLIMRIKGYLKKEMVVADWSGKDAPVDEVSGTLASRLMTICLGERSGNIGNCLVDKMAKIFEVPSKDADDCKSGHSIRNKVACMGYAAALALFEPRLS